MTRNGLHLLSAAVVAGCVLAACVRDHATERFQHDPDGRDAIARTDASPGGAMGSDQPVTRSEKACDLQLAMRRLWTDHVVWTRDYIVAAVAGAGDADEAAKRLLRNQQEIGSALVPYYGADGGRKLAGLLTDHIKIAVDVVDAAKKGDEAKLKDADKRWHDNAAELGAFLAAWNPNWRRDEMTSMLDEHLKLTTNEATYRLHARWSDDVANYDEIFRQAMGMADGLTDGIVKQFPDRFR